MGKQCNALDVANYLIFLMNDTCDDLTNMKLNKLIYYAQGHCLQQTGSPMFDDVIEAWDHGPIVNAVYQKYKDYANNAIHEYDQDTVGHISNEDRDILLGVARKYGRYTAAALRHMTHVPKSPWAQSYIEGGIHVPIPTKKIKEYFDAHEEKLSPVEIQISEDDFVGYRDSEGYLVLPEDWNDEEI